MSFVGNIVRLFAVANRPHIINKSDFSEVDVDIKADVLPPVSDLWPDDEDAVPTWRLDQEARAAAGGYRLPNYRTGQEFQAAVALCETRLTTPVVVTPPLRPNDSLLPILAPDVAARLFLEWIRSRSLCGPISTDDLSIFYAEFCTERGERQSPENIMRSRLKRLPGVSSRVADKYLPGGGRVRQTIWLISADPIKKAA